jgi:O-antigen/teichoic acid export membrane protein
MVKSYSFSQNTLFLLIAYIFQKVLVFFYFIFLARYLGPNDFGIYSFVFSFLGMFSVFLDLGFGTVLIREISKNKAKTGEYLNTSLGFKIISSIVVSLIIIVVINLLGYQSATRNLVYFSILWIVFESFAGTIFAALRGWENLRYEAIGSILNKGAYVFFGLLFVFLKLPLIAFSFPLVIGGLLFFIYPMVVAKKFFKLGIALDKKIIKNFFKVSVSLIFGSIFATIFTAINIVLVSFLSTDYAAGIFSAAFRIPMAILFLPSALGASIFPVFSSLVNKNRQRLVFIFEKSIFYMIFLSLPIILAGFVLGDKIILLMYGQQFSESVLPFNIIMASLLFMFLDFLFSSLLTALDKQKENAVLRALGLTINIVLCFILIPKFTYLGSAIGFSIGFATFSIVQMILIFRNLSINFLPIIKKFILVLIASAVMALALFIFRNYLHLILNIFLGIIVYFVVLYLIGGINRDDLTELKKLVKSSFKKEARAPIEVDIQESDKI